MTTSLRSPTPTTPEEDLVDVDDLCERLEELLVFEEMCFLEELAIVSK